MMVDVVRDLIGPAMLLYTSLDHQATPGIYPLRLALTA